MEGGNGFVGEALRVVEGGCVPGLGRDLLAMAVVEGHGAGAFGLGLD